MQADWQLILPDPFLNEASAIVINQDTIDKNPQPTIPLI
jgi:hypothetical protein